MLGGSLGIEWDIDELFRYRLRVIIVAAGLQGFVVFIDGLVAITLGVISVAAFDVGPSLDPLGFAADPVERRLEIVERQLPVLLFEINQPQIVINPGVVAIELERRFQLLLGLGVLTFFEQFYTATGNDGNLQIVGHAQNLVVRIDFSVNWLAI